MSSGKFFQRSVPGYDFPYTLQQIGDGGNGSCLESIEEVVDDSVRERDGQYDDENRRFVEESIVKEKPYLSWVFGQNVRSEAGNGANELDEYPGIVSKSNIERFRERRLKHTHLRRRDKKEALLRKVPPYVYRQKPSSGEEADGKKFDRREYVYDPIRVELYCYRVDRERYRSDKKPRPDRGRKFGLILFRHEGDECRFISRDFSDALQVTRVVFDPATAFSLAEYIYSVDMCEDAQMLRSSRRQLILYWNEIWAQHKRGKKIKKFLLNHLDEMTPLVLRYFPFWRRENPGAIKRLRDTTS